MSQALLDTGDSAIDMRILILTWFASNKGDKGKTESKQMQGPPAQFCLQERTCYPAIKSIISWQPSELFGTFESTLTFKPKSHCFQGDFPDNG